MFDCGITSIQNKISEEIVKKHDELVMQTVYQVGIDIDKQKLVEAMTNAKSFYDQGYNDAKRELEAELEIYKKAFAMCAGSIEYQEYFLQKAREEE